MGDKAPPSTGESTQDIIQALTKYLPGYMQVQNEQVGPQARTEQDVAEEISPRKAQLMQNLYEQYRPRLAEIGSDIENINRTRAAKTDLDILRGSGKDLATEAQNVDKTLNPEFYKTRATTSDKLGELLGSINLNDANPEAERLINQENQRAGNLGNSSATSTVSNALSFGNELDKRRQSLGAAVGQATNFLQPSQGQFNPIVTALGRSSTNAGQNNFTGVAQPGSQAYQSGAQLLGSATALKQQQQDINANRRTGLDVFNQGLSSIPT